MNATLPRVNALAQVDVPVGGASLHSRVEDVAGATVTIAAPDWSGPDPVGTKVILRWSSEAGQIAVQGVVAQVVTRPIEMWVVRTDGRPRVVQPRSHERVTRAVEVTVDVVDRRPPVRFVAESLDLSRSGLRLRTHDWVLLEHGDEVRLRLGREDPPAIAAGTVVHPERIRNVLDFAVALRQPVPERAALLLRRLARQAADDRPLSRGWRR